MTLTDQERADLMRVLDVVEVDLIESRLMGGAVYDCCRRCGARALAMESIKDHGRECTITIAKRLKLAIEAREG